MHVCVYMHTHLCLYISLWNGETKSACPWGHGRQHWVCQGRKQHLSYPCDILGSSLSQKMPSRPAADKIKCSKEGCSVFMSKSEPLWEVSCWNNCLYSVYSEKLVLISPLASYMPVTPLAFSQTYLKTWNLPCVLEKNPAGMVGNLKNQWSKQSLSAFPSSVFLPGKKKN